MWNRKELKEAGKVRFTANYWPSVLGALCLMAGAASSGSAGKNSKEVADSITSNPLTIIAIVIAAIIAIILGMALKILVFNPLSVGGYRFFVVNHDDKAQAKEVGYAFKSGYYWNIVKIMFLMGLYEFLWSLLLVIPGIIKSYEYRMIPFLLAENPAISAEEAFEVTKGMMTGNKMDTFCLDLSFIGWWILTGITFGILGIFYTNPYYCATNAELFFTLKNVGASDVVDAIEGDIVE